MKSEDGTLRCDYVGRQDCSGPPRWQVSYSRQNVLLGEIKARHHVCDDHLLFDCERADGVVKVVRLEGEPHD